MWGNMVGKNNTERRPSRKEEEEQTKNDSIVRIVDFYYRTSPGREWAKSFRDTHRAKTNNDFREWLNN